MNLASCFYDRKVRVRDFISHNTIKEGTILKVYPAKNSHVCLPYLVRVIFVNEYFFRTEMIDKTGHIRTFDFNSEVWKEYHHCRFKIHVY